MGTKSVPTGLEKTKITETNNWVIGRRADAVRRSANPIATIRRNRDAFRLTALALLGCGVGEGFAKQIAVGVVAEGAALVGWVDLSGQPVGGMLLGGDFALAAGRV